VFADARVDLILHAGDVDDLRALESLGQVAPVVAVQGNVHFFDLSRGGAELPYHVELTLQRRGLILTHGHQRGLVVYWDYAPTAMAHRLGVLSRERINRYLANRLHRRFPWADIVVFGHTHRPFQTWIGHTFFFNPGGVSQAQNGKEKPSVGILTIGADLLEAEIVSLCWPEMGG